MKTTIEVSDTLFRSAIELARTRQTTLSVLVEDGLRLVLSEVQTKADSPFKLKDARVYGQQVLIAEPRRWQQMEEEHVASRTFKPLH